MNVGFKAVLMFVLIVGMVAAACAPQPAAPAPTPASKEGVTPLAVTPKPAAKTAKVKAQVPSRATSLLPFFLGKEKGIYKAEEIDLELPLILAGIAVPALLSGEVDYLTGVATAMAPAFLGAPMKAIMATTGAGIWHIFVGPEVSSPADLKGKSVATMAAGSTAYYATKKAMASLGLDADKDLIYINLPTDARYPALKSKSVGASLLSPPFDVIAREEGYKSLVFTGDIIDLPGNGLSTTDKKLKDSPDEVRRMIRATIKSMAYIKDNRQEALAFIVKEFGLEEKIARVAYEDGLKITIFDGSITPKGIEGVIDMARASGQIKGTVAAEKAVDLAALKEVQKELGLAR